MEWNEFKKVKQNPFEKSEAPYDGNSFLACIWGEWVGQSVYARHYDATDRCPGKYEFFYVTKNPEEYGWQIRIEEDPFPITHWAPLPKPSEEHGMGES